MANDSRISVNPETGIPDIRDFAEFGAALRSLSTDEESHRLTDGMGELSIVIEKVGKSLSSQERGAVVGPLLVDLLNTLRRHRQLVLGLSESWRSLYEHASYLAALNNFRVLVAQWLMERNISGDNQVVIDDFEMIAWRTLGEGLMMIDIHEQVSLQALAQSQQADLEASRVKKAQNWWGKIRGADAGNEGDQQ